MERDRYRGEPSGRFSQSPWNRPPPRSFNPNGFHGRARTPSPGPSYASREAPWSVDVRDRDRPDVGGPSRVGRDFDRDRERRWNGGREERFGEENRSLPTRRPSPTKQAFRDRPSSPPPPRWRSSSIPRNGPPAQGRQAPSFGPRDRDWERAGPGAATREFGARSPGPASDYPIPQPRDGDRDRPYSTHGNVPGPGSVPPSTRSSPGAVSSGAPRSMRGNSSPVISRIPDVPQPSTGAASGPAPAPGAPSGKAASVKSEPEEGELEEGEVLSPVRPPREVLMRDRERDRDIHRERERERDRDRERDQLRDRARSRDRDDGISSGPGSWSRTWPRRSPPPASIGLGAGAGPGLGRRPSNIPPPRGYRGRPPSMGGNNDRAWAPRHVSPTKGPVDNGWNGFARRKVSGEDGSGPSSASPIKTESAAVAFETQPVTEQEEAVLLGDQELDEPEQDAVVRPKEEPTTPGLPDLASAEDGADRPLTPERPPTPPLPMPEPAHSGAANDPAAERTDVEVEAESSTGPARADEDTAVAAPNPFAPSPKQRNVEGPEHQETDAARGVAAALPLSPSSPVKASVDVPALSPLPAAAVQLPSTGVSTAPVVKPPVGDGDSASSPIVAKAKLPASGSPPVKNASSAIAADIVMEEPRAAIDTPPVSQQQIEEGVKVSATANFEDVSRKPDVEDPRRPVTEMTRSVPAVETPARNSSTVDQVIAAITPSGKSRLAERRVVSARTIAERRSVQLPPTAEPLPPSLVTTDAMLTAVSAVESTDTKIWVAPEHDEEVTEDVRDANLVATVKSAQVEKVQLDAEAIMAWNIEASPTKSTRMALLDREIRKITRNLGRDRTVTRRVHIRQQEEDASEQRRIERLREEYLSLDREWQEHCKRLDDLMELRGPPPESLYSVPNAFLLDVTPGPMPSTPAAEEIGGRARRRGGMGAVNTEAEFQEILAAMADTAAKDPNTRAAKTTAVVPDMIPPAQRRLVVKDENDLVLDPIAFYDFEGLSEPIWTQEEEDLFKKRYLTHPKQFGKIAEGIPDKSAGDCVLYYYRTKKEKNWKGQLAVRRGMSTQKRKTPIANLIKKGGKSAALLSNLDAKKPTVDSTPVKPLPANLDKDRDGPGTPAEKSGRRKVKEGRKKSTLSTATTAVTPSEIGGEEEDGPIPEMKKVKPKAKRPRVSAVPDQSALIPDDSTVATTPGDSTAAAAAKSAQDELLPPVKRRKHRKTLAEPEYGPDGQLIVPTPRTGGAKRPGTSSYWTKDELTLLTNLLPTFKTDFKSIASQMPSKSERQVMNYCQQNAAALGLQPVEAEKPAGPFSRSIYDVYGPRLGTFPPLQTPGQASQPALRPAPPSEAQTPATEAAPAPAPVSRAGGMRISALLNDDPLPVPPRVDNTDNQSDATVDDTEDPRRSPAAYSHPGHQAATHPQVHPQAAHAHTSHREGSYTRPPEYRSVSGSSVGYYRTVQHPHAPHAQHPHQAGYDDRSRDNSHYREEPLARAQTAPQPQHYQYAYPHREEYPDRYSAHHNASAHSDEYRTIMAQRAYDRARVDYRPTPPAMTHEEQRYYEDRHHRERERERTYAAAAAMPPLHHPQPHHSLHRSQLSTARPTSTGTSISPHPSAAHLVPHHTHSHSHSHSQPQSHGNGHAQPHVSPLVQPGMIPVQHRSPYEPERLPSVHSVMDEQRER